MVSRARRETRSRALEPGAVRGDGRLTAGQAVECVGYNVEFIRRVTALSAIPMSDADQQARVRWAVGGGAATP